MPFFRKFCFFECLIAVFISFFFLISTSTSEGGAKKAISRDTRKTIVLNPGHGGNDSGAKGPDGSLEKIVTLALARMISSELSGKYRVVLTRTDDYFIDLIERTSIANQLKSDLFISIHTGGSFLHKTSGTTIFYYQGISGVPLEIDVASNRTVESGPDKTPWDEIQLKHINSSRVLADLIKKGLQGIFKGFECEIRDAPILVLSGADMPSIHIELGYLTNPADEKSFRDQEFLSKAAKGISQGLDAFLQHRSIKPPNDLRK